MKYSTAFSPADILIPQGIDMKKWAVVACDQFTSQREYWEQTADIAKGAPSALNIILPEVYLNDADADERIEKINSEMKKYLADGIFKEYKDTFIYVRRTDSTGKVREGLVGKIDLEQYDYNKGSTTPVRATEATVAERIPPRLRVRKNADLELPHIMILIDDPGRTVIEPLAEKASQKVYSFDLMQKGGHIEGYLADGEAAVQIDKALAALSEKSPLLYAMGDGNHSLATAKAHYEQLKKDNPGKDLSDHPARYALCEIVNLHSPALEFEAIHRIITDVDAADLISSMKEKLGLSEAGSGQQFRLVSADEDKLYTVTRPTSNLCVGSVQMFIDEYLRAHGGAVDYIHGTDTVLDLVKKGGIGIILPDMAKEDLFPTVINDGALPRKTFSMGHAEDKRYYVEARRITL